MHPRPVLERVGDEAHFEQLDRREVAAPRVDVSARTSGRVTRIEADLGEDIVIESRPRLEGRQMVMMIAPK